MLWQYSITMTILLVYVESKTQRRLFRSVYDTGKLAKPLSQSFRNQPSLRIRNEYPFQLQGGEENVQIREGNVTNTHNFPYMAAVLINSRLWCAGAIVDPNWVLTAAHCLNLQACSIVNHIIGVTTSAEMMVKEIKKPALLPIISSVLHVSPSQSLNKYVKVRVGSSKAREGGTLLDVVGAVTHPKYELEPVPHADIALLKLAYSLDFHKFVNMIQMYDGTTEPFAQSFVEVSGWGATRGSETSYHEHSPDMLTARLKVRPERYCVDSYQLVDAFQFTSDFFCASLRNGTRDACLFDAGAPAVQKDQLMGLMSFGPEKCGHTFQPAVFIKTFYFRDFVENTIADYKNTRDSKILKKEMQSDAEPTADPEYGNANILLISNEEVDKNAESN